ncbi:MAG: hypothetical protein PUP46_11175 [Endozoicomonas sp. (ex Botrylloides leachii)]|nr:hypothetical protein [Endozoicomonas sp. (ex Botrylloides leachii)]
MYTDEDLDEAVQKGIFSTPSVLAFRAQFGHVPDEHSVDEENFRMVASFNDIFVVIACALLLYSSYYVLGEFNDTLSYLSAPLIAWGLSEFFVRKRKLALPAIVLMLAFVGGIYFLIQHVVASFSEKTYIVASACAALAAFVHYRRFKVPITVAAGAAASAGFVIALFIYYFPEMTDLLQAIILITGIATFILAMLWDTSDITRTTYRTDVAFWLHLLSAPMIVHPIFSYLGILQGNHSYASISMIILLYIVMSLFSIAIDRRAFMVSSLLYVIYALSNLFTLYGVVGYSLAATGMCIGSGLLLLSAFWQQTRRRVLMLLPTRCRQFLPSA